MEISQLVYNIVFYGSMVCIMVSTIILFALYRLLSIYIYTKYMSIKAANSIQLDDLRLSECNLYSFQAADKITDQYSFLDYDKWRHLSQYYIYQTVSKRPRVQFKLDGEKSYRKTSEGVFDISNHPRETPREGLTRELV